MENNIEKSGNGQYQSKSEKYALVILCVLIIASLILSIIGISAGGNSEFFMFYVIFSWVSVILSIIGLVNYSKSLSRKAGINKKLYKLILISSITSLIVILLPILGVLGSLSQVPAGTSF
jgi:hypothetical protein